MAALCSMEVMVMGSTVSSSCLASRGVGAQSKVTPALGELQRNLAAPLQQSERRRLVGVRAAQKQDTPLPDTKVDITEAGVTEHEKEEPLRVFDSSPASQFFRPETERRPELGNKEFTSVMKFDGPAPETINGRLAMLGIVWAFAAEINSGLTVVQQVTQSTGVIWFVAAAATVIWASFVPIFGSGESPDSRKVGPFNAKAERWNGRAAMIGFASLILTEQLLINGPLLAFLHLSKPF